MYVGVDGGGDVGGDEVLDDVSGYFMASLRSFANGTAGTAGEGNAQSRALLPTIVTGSSSLSSSANLDGDFIENAANHSGALDDRDIIDEFGSDVSAPSMTKSSITTPLPTASVKTSCLGKESDADVAGDIDNRGTRVDDNDCVDNVDYEDVSRRGEVDELSRVRLGDEFAPEVLGSTSYAPPSPPSSPSDVTLASASSPSEEPTPMNTQEPSSLIDTAQISFAEDAQDLSLPRPLNGLASADR